MAGFSVCGSLSTMCIVRLMEKEVGGFMHFRITLSRKIFISEKRFGDQNSSEAFLQDHRFEHLVKRWNLRSITHDNQPQNTGVKRADVCMLYHQSEVILHHIPRVQREWMLQILRGVFFQDICGNLFNRHTGEDIQSVAFLWVGEFHKCSPSVHTIRFFA